MITTRAKKYRTGIIKSTLIITLLLFGGFPTIATAAAWGPWQATASNPQRSLQTEINPLDQAVRTFQKYISPIDGARCPMYPTCSAYSRQALHKHGPLLGMFMTADRLMHEGDPIEQQEPILKWGHRRFFDPLKYNDFWLRKD